MTKLLLFVEKFCVFIQKEDYHFCIWLFVKNFDVYSTKKDVEIIFFFYGIEAKRVQEINSPHPLCML